MRIILLGPPGAGKGTYGEGIAKHFSLPIISVGELLRQQVKEGTALGKKAKAVMDTGSLVDDRIVLGMLKQRLTNADCAHGYILDGFPRTVAQATGLQEVDVAVNFEVTEETVLERLANRITCAQCGAIYHLKNRPPKKAGICDSCGGELYQRDDQKPQTVKERLRVYHEKSAAVVDYYRQKGILVSIDANGWWQDITKDTINALDAFMRTTRR